MESNGNVSCFFSLQKYLDFHEATSTPEAATLHLLILTLQLVQEIKWGIRQLRLTLLQTCFLTIRCN